MLPVSRVLCSEVLTLDDIVEHTSVTEECISGKYGNKNLWKFFLLRLLSGFHVPTYECFAKIVTLFRKL